MTDGSAGLPVTVTLEASLHAEAGGAAAAWIEQELLDLRQDLRVPGTPAVRLVPDPAPPRGQLVRVSVAGRPCRVSRRTFAEALGYVTGAPAASPDADAGAVLESLRGDGAGLLAERLGELAALACRAAVSAQPEVLLPAGHPLAPLLALGVPLPVGAADQPWALVGSIDNIETLISEYASPEINLFVAPGYLRALTGDGGENLFPSMREGIFAGLGFVVPRLRLRTDASLRPRGFAFGCNAVRTVPRIGLEPEQILVNDTPERLKLMNTAGAPALDALGRPAAVVSRARRDVLEAAGLTAWGPLEYFVSCCQEAIRENADRLLTANAARSMLRQLELAFPVLVAAANDAVLDETIARVLRGLLRDGVSVRNLRRIVETLLRFATTAQEPGADAPGAGDPLDAVRAGLADQIASAHARGTSTVVAYLLDPEFEAAASQRGPDGLPDERVTEQLCDALSAETSHLYATAPRPVILTTGALRGIVRERLRREFPEFSVLSYQEIPADYNVQAVARLSWSL